MKLHLLLLVLVFGLFSLGSYANELDTVALANKKANKFPTMLAGIIVKALDKKSFIIKDTTGEMQIELYLTDNEKIAFFKKYPTLINANVVINGNLDKEAFKTTKIKVTQIKVIDSPSYDPFINALSGNLSGVKSIRVTKSLNDKEQVLLYGVISHILNNNEFILRDKEGSDIRIKLDFYSKTEETSFMNQTLTGATVVLEGFLDKEFVEKTKVDANRIQIITRSVNDPFAGVVNKAK